MKHPIYRDAFIARMYGIWKNDRNFFKEQAIGFIRDGSETEESVLSYMEDFAMMEAVEKNGMVLIEADRGEWESNISKKTLSKMKVGDIKLPFSAGAITSSALDSGYMLFTRAMVNTTREDCLMLHVPVDELPEHDSLPSESVDNRKRKEGMVIITLLNSSVIGDDVSKLSENEANYVYSTLSMLMYISLFKNDNSRIKETRLRACSASKKKGTPKHRVNKIVLQQKVSKDKEGVTSSKRGTLTKAHIVRGHWRNQWYASLDSHKPKWIDPYWKGDGKEKIEKIYVIKDSEKEIA